MKANAEKWMFIVNPKAGSGKALCDWDAIAKLLEMEEIEHDYIFTEYPFHGIELAKQKWAEGYRKFVAVGGDGSLHEVVNGIMQSDEKIAKECKIAIIPIGNGNDWGRTYHLPSAYISAIQTIKAEKSILQDLAYVHYSSKKGKESRYIVNMAGMGFDAFVCNKVNKQKEKGKSGQMRYLVNLFSSLMSYKITKIRVLLDNKKIEEDEIFSLNVGICQYNGGGMKQLPLAISDDGLLDITVIKKISKAKIIRKIKMLFDGSFIELPEVSTYRGKSVTIISNKKLLMEVDGEVIGSQPYEFGIIPKAIQLIVK
jgi:YegS/Rv2252/BmrU family lipid kinase